MPKVEIIVPERPVTRSGNWVTAQRYLDLLVGCGYDARILHDGRIGSSAEQVIVLNAFRSADWVSRCGSETRVIVVLTGTDLYQYLETDRDIVLGCLHRADAIVSIHANAHLQLPAELHERHETILQSASSLDPSLKSPSGCLEETAFNFIVVGHLRDVKDPLRAAFASRDLPSSSTIHIHQFGDAYDEQWRTRARAEMAANPRYTWHGALDGPRLANVLLEADAMVISSKLEGGANVVSEAIMAELPILASSIPGNVGVIGDGYDGYFAVEDTAGLRQLMLRCEREVAFVDRLRAKLQKIRPRFTAEVERAAWMALLDDRSQRCEGLADD